MGRTHAKKTKAGRPQKKKTSTSDDLLHTSRAFTLTLSHPPQPAPGLQPAAKICVVRLLRALLVHELRPVPGGEGAEDPRGHPGTPGALPRPPFRRYRRRARPGHHGLGAARQRDPCPSVCRPGEALEEVNQAAKLFCFVCLAFLPRSWCGAFPLPLLKGDGLAIWPPSHSCPPASTPSRPPFGGQNGNSPRSARMPVHRTEPTALGPAPPRPNGPPKSFSAIAEAKLCFELD